MACPDNGPIQALFLSFSSYKPETSIRVESNAVPIPDKVPVPIFKGTQINDCMFEGTKKESFDLQNSKPLSTSWRKKELDSKTMNIDEIYNLVSKIQGPTEDKLHTVLPQERNDRSTLSEERNVFSHIHENHSNSVNYEFKAVSDDKDRKSVV